MAVRSMFVLTNYNGTFYSQMQRTKDILLCLPKTVVTNKVYHLDVITIISSNTVELPSLSFYNSRTLMKYKNKLIHKYLVDYKRR